MLDCKPPGVTKDADESNTSATEPLVYVCRSWLSPTPGLDRAVAPPPPVAELNTTTSPLTISAACEQAHRGPRRPTKYPTLIDTSELHRYLLPSLTHHARLATRRDRQSQQLQQLRQLHQQPPTTRNEHAAPGHQTPFGSRREMQTDVWAKSPSFLRAISGGRCDRKTVSVLRATLP